MVLLSLLQRRGEGALAPRPTGTLTDTKVLGASLALGTFLLLAACGGPQGHPPISRQDYVDTYVEILRASDEAGNELDAAQASQEILERRGISEDDLLKYARYYDNDTEYLANVWMEIEMRLRNPEPDSTTLADSAAVGGGRE